MYHVLKKILAFLFFISSLVSIGQTKEIDSLKEIIKTTDSLKVKAVAHGRIAWLHLTTNTTIAEKHLDTSFHIMSSLNNPAGMAQVNYRYAVLFRLTGEYDKALDFIEKSYGYHKSQKDTAAIANDLFQKGVIYSLKGDYQKSIDAYYNILEIYEKINDKKGVGMTWNSIGIVYKNLEQYNKAIDAYKKSIGILQHTNFQLDLANSYGNLGAVYSIQNSLDSALVYYEKARKIDYDNHYDWGFAINNQNIGALYIQKKDYQKAVTYLGQAYSIQKKNNYKTALTETLLQLGRAYYNQGNYRKSEQFLKESLLTAPKSKKILRDIYFSFYELYKKSGYFQKSLNYFETYSAYNDTILKNENLKSINEIAANYESAKKDKEISEQKLTLEKQELELQKKRSQSTLMTGLIIFLLAASFLTWFLYQQHHKRKNQEILALKREQQVKTLESLMEGQENERLRIAKELHDGVNVDLSTIKYKLTSLVEKNNKVISEAVALIDKSCEQVRAISHNLIPPSLKDFSLIEAIEDYCSTMNSLHKPSILFQHIGAFVTLSKKVEVNILE